MLEDYLPILIILIFSVLLAGGLLGISNLLGPKRYSKNKLTPYECGVPPVGDARERFSVKYYLVAALGGDCFITTKLSSFANWARKNSLWPMPFGTACCAIEMMGVFASRFDLSRFGAEVVRFSPRQADLMIVSGTITS